MNRPRAEFYNNAPSHNAWDKPARGKGNPSPQPIRATEPPVNGCVLKKNVGCRDGVPHEALERFHLSFRKHSL